ncbi:MAG: single-stranded DNA-binding protein [Massilibacteroides sp.]|nr:single-stranded DNA-binding protein [Massilibacteroides sp.]MDD3062206.1 single-stranded DNA-binding protein [Massilibacteroides sp.]MDD4114432.1 single-stranded DNA-binding protein [Massilibacteroides sp.]MDD4659724.1 single-stranded DNA-binding protein [Massilibacteroides sp.]
MSLNKVLLIGNVGKDPEVRYFDSGAAVANFPLATSERGYTLANGTVVPDRTDWHNIVVRRDQVSFVEKWVKKGSLLYVEGKIRNRSYDDQNGIKRYVTEIHADRVEFFSLGTRQAESQTTGQQTSTSASFSEPVSTYQQPNIDQASSNTETSDADDLPF